MRPAPPPTISVRQSASLIGISPPSSAYAAIKAGNFPVSAIQIGNRYVVPTKPPLLELLGLDELPDLEGSAA